MASVEIKLDDLPEAMRKSAELRTAAAMKGLRRAARRGEGLMVQRSAAFSDQGVFMGAWDVEEEDGEIVLLNDAPHAAIVESGSRPHWPPLFPILAYLGRKMGVSTNAVASKSEKYDLSDQEIFKSDENLEKVRRRAFALAASIAAKGTKPKHLLRDGQKDFIRFIKEEVDKALREAAA